MAFTCQANARPNGAVGGGESIHPSYLPADKLYSQHSSIHGRQRDLKVPKSVGPPTFELVMVAQPPAHTAQVGSNRLTNCSNQHRGLRTGHTECMPKAQQGYHEFKANLPTK